MSQRLQPGLSGVALLGLAVAACAQSMPPSPSPSAPQPTRIEQRPIPPSGVHVVERGETLLQIALVYDLDLDTLARANAMEDADHLLAGRPLALRWPEPPAAGVPRRPPDQAADGAGDGPPAAPYPPLRVVVTPRDDLEPHYDPARDATGPAVRVGNVEGAAPQE